MMISDVLCHRGVGVRSCLGSQSPESQSGFRALRKQLPRALLACKATHVDVGATMAAGPSNRTFRKEELKSHKERQHSWALLFMCKTGKQLNARIVCLSILSGG